MGESVITSVLKFNRRAQRPPDSSCLRDDTISFSGNGSGTHWTEIATLHSLESDTRYFFVRKPTDLKTGLDPYDSFPVETAVAELQLSQLGNLRTISIRARQRHSLREKFNASVRARQRPKGRHCSRYSARGWRSSGLRPCSSITITCY